MSLDDSVRKFLDDSGTPEASKEGIQALWESHLTAGRNLQIQGRLREAVAEYAKEHARPIRSASDAEIVQWSHWFAGRAYRELGEIESAIAAFQKAQELLEKYNVGSYPYEELAEIFIEQGQLDEAIDMCRKSLERSNSWRTKQLLERAIALKESRAS